VQEIRSKQREVAQNTDATDASVKKLFGELAKEGTLFKEAQQ